MHTHYSVINLKANMKIKLVDSQIQSKIDSFFTLF